MNISITWLFFVNGVALGLQSHAGDPITTTWGRAIKVSGWLAGVRHAVTSTSV